MAKTQLEPIGTSQWSSDADTYPGRVGWNSELANLNAKAARWLQGSTGNRPVAANPGRYFWATDTFRLWYDDGSAWTEVSPVGGGGTPTAGSVGVAGGEGVSRIAARADHQHALLVPNADPAPSSYGGAAGQGVSPTVARADHAHALTGLPFATAPPGPSAYGVLGVTGGSTNLARQDHTHSLPNPATPVSNHLREAELVSYAGDRSPGDVMLFGDYVTVPAQGAYFLEVEAYVPLLCPYATTTGGFLKFLIGNVLERTVRWHNQQMPMSISVSGLARSSAQFPANSAVGINVILTIDPTSSPVRWASGSVSVNALRPSIGVL